MKIKNLQDVPLEQLKFELQAGAKFVVFPYCFSIIILTFKRSSDIYFIKPGESTLKYALKYILISFLFGWWGFPWGPIHTVGSIFKNLFGGNDVTAEMMKAFNKN